MKKITSSIFYAGVDDHRPLFEGQYDVPEGMSYNSYVVVDEKIAVFDTVDAAYGHEWLDNLAEILGDRQPDYLIVQHMEPDHSANIVTFKNTYPGAKIVGNTKTFAMMKQFFGRDFEDERVEVKDGDTLSLGSHSLTFVFAPMVHWPEVMLTYESSEKVLFAADAFGKFGAAGGEAVKPEDDWACEARRYYFGIVGKYGAQVQALLKKAAALEIEKILSLHGPLIMDNIGYFVSLYNTWSSYEFETDGVCIAYTSVYGNTKKAAELIRDKLIEKGCPVVTMTDLARDDMAEAVEDAFRYSKLVLASTTYNAGVFPFMREFLEHLTERSYQKRTVAFVENGSWAPMAAKTMKKLLEGAKNLTFVEPTVTIKSALTDENKQQIEALTDELSREYVAQSSERANKNDLTALFKIGYGLYVVTSNDGKRDNGLIVNTVSQVTNTPNRVAVCINKQNYSHHVIKQTGVMNVNCLSVDAPFSVFECFGFRSGRNVNKFADQEAFRSDNGLVFLPKYINAFMSLKVENYVDLDTHGMFICTVTEARVVSERETMTYTYYQNNVKPKPQPTGKKGWVCKICGYVHEGEELPEDFVCPLCKHGAADFEPLP